MPRRKEVYRRNSSLMPLLQATHMSGDHRLESSGGTPADTPAMSVTPTSSRRITTATVSGPGESAAHTHQPYVPDDMTKYLVAYSRVRLSP